MEGVPWNTVDLALALNYLGIRSTAWSLDVTPMRDGARTATVVGTYTTLISQH